jgi:hypothetical protein
MHIFIHAYLHECIRQHATQFEKYCMYHGFLAFSSFVFAHTVSTGSHQPLSLICIRLME